MTGPGRPTSSKGRRKRSDQDEPEVAEGTGPIERGTSQRSRAPSKSQKDKEAGSDEEAKGEGAEVEVGAEEVVTEEAATGTGEMTSGSSTPKRQTYPTLVSSRCKQVTNRKT